MIMATGIGTGVDGLTIIMTPVVGSDKIRWTNTGSVSHTAASEAIRKNNAS